jgi:hypothetical protein
MVLGPLETVGVAINGKTLGFLILLVTTVKMISLCPRTVPKISAMDLCFIISTLGRSAGIADICWHGC